MAKKESTFFNMTLTLFLVAAAAAIALGMVYNVTKAPIEASRKAKTKEAISLVLPEFDNITEKKVMPEGGRTANDSLSVYDATLNGEYIGTAIRSYTDMGFTERFWVMAGFLPDGTIHDALVLSHKETPGLGDKMEKEKSDWTSQYKGKHPDSFNLKVKKDGGDVDAITAATISSRAFSDAVDRAFKTFNKIKEDK